eukprot:4745072-Lingulodinium_polyedra.AAC.1
MFAKTVSQQHVNVLEKNLEPAKVAKECLSISDKMLNELAKSWSTDLQELCDPVAKGCPTWQPLANDPELLHEDRVKLFLTNP